MGYFIIKSKKNLDDLKVGERIEESDYSLMSANGYFTQFQYIEDDDYNRQLYQVKPGLYSINKTMTGYVLEKSAFTKDKILNEFIATQHIVDKIDCFFKNLDKYKEYGIDVPKRAALLYGTAGGGKSTAIDKAVEKYIKDDKTLIVIYPTDKFEAYQVKDFIKSFQYTEVEKVILIMEDIGGVEADQVRIRSNSSLLSLLDNNDKTFILPTFILATTNHPEVFLGNLTNRPGRFDDKIEVGFPTGEQRQALLKFFHKGELDEESLKLIADKKCEEFSPAHIKEVVIRAAIHDKTIKESIKELIQEIETFKKNFTKQKGMGFYD